MAKYGTPPHFHPKNFITKMVLEWPKMHFKHNFLKCKIETLNFTSLSLNLEGSDLADFISTHSPILRLDFEMFFCSLGLLIPTQILFELLNT